MSDTAPRNPRGAPQMLADALLRGAAGTTALLRVTGSQRRYRHVGGGPGGDYLRGGSGESGPDAQSCGPPGRKAESRSGSCWSRPPASQQQVDALDLVSAQALFAMTLAVTVAGQDYLIESIASNEAFGQVYLYRLLLREARQQGV